MKRTDVLRILVWSDLQAHPWQEAERPDRMNDLLGAVRNIRTLTEKQDIDLVVFLGDLFESKRAVRADVASKFYTELRCAWRSKKSLEPIPAFYVAGNHDYYGNTCTLDPLHGGMNIVLSAKTFPQVLHRTFPSASRKQYTLIVVPHGADVSLINHNVDYDLLFAHVPVVGARLAQGVIESTEGLPQGLLVKAGKRKAAIFGHYHTPGTLQRKGDVPIYFVGAPLCHNWGDLDDTVPRGCMIITLSKTAAEIERCPIGAQYPCFLREGSSAAKANDFILPAANVEAVEESRTHDNAAAIASTTSHARSLAAYIKHTIPDASDKKKLRLLKQGLGLLKATRV